jgi:ribonuclease HIII
VNRPVTRSLTPSQIRRLRDALGARGLRLVTNPKNPYIAFEVRTDGRSIVTLYTSGKLVSTLRDGDAEGASLGALVDEVCGAAGGGGSGPAGESGPTSAADEPAVATAARRSRTRPPTLAEGRGTRPGLKLLLGCDETGTGELLGRAVVGGAALPPASAQAVADLVAHVDTKISRAASGWELLDERLRGLPDVRLVTLPVPNRLFDAWSKNGLLDLCYVRVAGDLLAACGLGAGRPADGLAGVELAIDDYGAGSLLTQAVAAWRGDGAHVLLQPKADDEHLAARAASVAARAARAREFEGLLAENEGGPLGTGNAGHPETLRWMKRRAAAGTGWPSFVKASFRTARDLLGLPEAEKRRVPPLAQLMDEDSAAAFLRARLDVSTAAWRCDPAGTALVREFRVRADGSLVAPQACLAWDFLPLLSGGIVLAPELELAARKDPGLLTPLLDRERGLLSGWRVLVGPEQQADDALLVALARAHRAGIVTVQATDELVSSERARRAGAVGLKRAKTTGEFTVSGNWNG